MKELSAIERYLEFTLKNDLTLSNMVGGRIRQAPLSEGVTYPAVVWHLHSATDRMVVSGSRILSHAIYLVEAIGPAETIGGLVNIAERIDYLMHTFFTKNVNADGTVFSCIRERPFSIAERDEKGQTFRRLGGFYKLAVKKS